ncbi:MAG TPA: hypothetical protein VMW66_00840 [Elusimicrobiales bacterium]|nr:hypothetical protein [Elusimicrobiales bacterium]
MKERDFQTQFSKRNIIHGVFELKFCKGKSLPFNALAEHQEKALLAVSGDGLFHKITDQPVFANSGVRFTRPKPFDCFFLSQTMAYVVIMFWIPRKKKSVYYVKIEDWIRMRDKATRKSATEEMVFKSSTIYKNYLDKRPKT